MKVKLTILESKCRGNYHKAGDTYIVEDICPPLCHELWQSIYPNVYTLLNNGNLDYGNTKAKKFKMRCPDNGRVLIQGEVIEEIDYMDIVEKVQFKSLNLCDCTSDLLKNFNRYQEVNKCWRKENNKWLLKDISFTEQWNDAKKSKIILSYENCIKNGGYVFGAFLDKQLIGCVSLENDFFGKNKEYVQLELLHVSYKYRNRGIGKKLFLMSCDKAKNMGAKKLYISAHSSVESIAFYKTLGCIEAEEINQTLADKEPCDCQLEYIL